MQTQNQKYIKWVPKRNTYIQNTKKKKDEDFFIKKISQVKIENNEVKEEKDKTEEDKNISK